MNDLSLLSEAQMAKISPYFPKPHGRGHRIAMARETYIL